MAVAKDSAGLADGRQTTSIAERSQRRSGNTLSDPHRPIELDFRQTEHRYRAVVDLVPDAVVVTDEDGCVTLVNRQAEALFGYKREELLGRPVARLVPQWSRAMARAHASSQMLTPDAGQRLEARRRNGDSILIDLRLSRLPARHRGKGKPALIGSMRDVSESYILEQERLSRTESFTTAFEAIPALPEAAANVDLDRRNVPKNEPSRHALSTNSGLPEQDIDVAGLIAEFESSGTIRRELGISLPREQSLEGRLLQDNPIANEPSSYKTYQGQDDAVDHINLNHGAAKKVHGPTHSDMTAPRDVTQQRELEQLAHERADTLSAIFEATPDGLAFYDAQGRMLNVNIACRKLLGLDADSEYASLPLSDRARRLQVFDEQGRPISAGEWPHWRALRGELIAGADAMEVRIRTLDGRDVWASITGAPVYTPGGETAGVVLMTRDVTTRRRLEGRTHEALNALLAMAQMLVDPLDASDDDADRGLSVLARQLAELTRGVLGCQRVGVLALEPGGDALRPLAVVGASARVEKGWRDSYRKVPSMSKRFAPSVLACLREGSIVVLPDGVPGDREGRAKYSKGAWLIAPLRLAGQIVGLLRLDYGVGEHRYSAEELALAEAVARFAALALERATLLRERQAARANELAQIEVNRRMDEFLAIASHDVRAPLTVTIGALQLVLARVDRWVASIDGARGALSRRSVLDFANRVRESVALADKKASQLGHMVAKLFDMAQVQAATLKMETRPCELAALVRDQVEDARATSPTRTIRFSAAHDRPLPVIADESRIGEVVTNFLSNALKYSPEDRPVEVRVEARSGRAIVSVRDQGPGLSPEEQTVVWERYHRGSGRDEPGDVAGGLGLGLYICKAIVAGHGGEVGIESEVGNGSTFWFSLPLAG